MQASPKLDMVVACAILLAWVAYGTARAWGTWPIDLSALWMAGRLWDEGAIAHLYDAPTRFFAQDFSDRWLSELAEVGHADKIALPFVYPPIWAWVLSGLGSVPPLIFFALGQMILLACAAATVFVLWRLARPATSATVFTIGTVLIAEATIPFQFAAKLGQPQLILILLIALSFERYAAGAWRLAAVLLGVAAAIKVTPILLVLVFLAERDWRTSLLSVLVAGMIAGLSVAVAGVDPHLAFLARVSELNSLAPMVGLNVTFEAMMQWEFIAADDRAHFPHPKVADNVGWIVALERVGLLASIAWACLSASSLPRRERLLMRMLAVLLATQLFGPLAWLHYYTLPVMGLLLLPGLVGWTRAFAIAGPVVAILAVPVRFDPNIQIAFEWVYPTGYWVAFAWYFAVLGLGRPERASVPGQTQGNTQPL